jgi:hypothetical protein
MPEGKNEASHCYWILSLEPERLKEPDSLAPSENDPGDGTDSSAKDAQAGMFCSTFQLLSAVGRYVESLQ